MMISTVMVLTRVCSAIYIVFLVIYPANTNSAFTITPSSQVVGVGQEAVFRCRNPTATAIGWIWNGSELAGSLPPGITVDSDTDLEILTIVAQSNYNETEIVCLAFSRSETLETTPVRLLIQGPLSMVTDIKRDSSTLSWEAPFSLDLTGVDPDIVYCVEVYNITCGVDDLVVGDCDVTQPSFVDNRLQQGYIYRITITPRSNGQDTQNGTSNTKEEEFIALSNPLTSIMSMNGSTRVTALIIFRHEGTGVEPASYTLNLTSIDRTEELSETLFVRSFTQDTNANSTTLRVSQPLPYRRLWNCQILALGCSEHPVTNLFEISSHDFRNVTVNSPRAGGISVTGDFIPGSSSIGILIVVYSVDNESNNTMIKYHFVHRSNIRRTITMTNLPNGQYEVSVFVVEGSGLPFNRSATTPRNISLIERGDVQSVFEYQLYPTSTGTCVNCTFLDNNSTGCVAVVHQRISQLSSSGLMNIESSHKFNRSGDTSYGCIDGVNMIDHQLGVFSLEEVVPTPPSSPDGVLDIGIIIVAIVVVLVTITLLLLAIILIVCCKKRKLSLFQSIREYIHTRKKSRASTTLRLTTDSSTSQTDDEKMYDKLRGPVKKSQIEEAHGSAPIYSTLDTHPPQSEGGVPSTVIYSILDKNPSQSVQAAAFTFLNLGPLSGVMGDDDLHKTAVQYCELQQEPQKEESFDEGAAAGNADNRCSGDTTQGDLSLDLSNESILCCFHSIQAPTMSAELTTFTGDQECATGEEATTCITQYTDAGNTDGQTNLST